MGDRVVKLSEDLLKYEPLVVGGEVSDKQDSADNVDCNSNKQILISSGKPKRGQANRRERVRTENVNAGFDKLRKLIPTDPEDRKLSKIEILRLATSYIKHLYNLTRANSCLEADEIYRLQLASDEEDQWIGDDNGSENFNKSSRSHVCTFCLMMTKVPLRK